MSVRHGSDKPVLLSAWQGIIEALEIFSDLEMIIIQDKTKTTADITTDVQWDVSQSSIIWYRNAAKQGVGLKKKTVQIKKNNYDSEKIPEN